MQKVTMIGEFFMYSPLYSSCNRSQSLFGSGDIKSNAVMVEPETLFAYAHQAKAVNAHRASRRDEVCDKFCGFIPSSYNHCISLIE